MSTEKGTAINIRVYNSPIMGSVSTAIYVTHLLLQVEPLWVFMTGVCAGNPQTGIKLGDLIIAKDVIDLNAGKMTVDGFRADVVTYETDAIPYATELIGSLKEESELISRESDPDKPIIWKTKLSVRPPLTDAIIRKRLLRAVYDVQAIKVNQAEKSALEGDKFSSDGIYYALQNRGLEVDEIRKFIVINSPQSLPATIDYETFRTTLKELSSAGELGQPKSECYSFGMDIFNTMRSRINNGEFVFSEPAPNIRIGTLGTDSSAVRRDLDVNKWIELVKRSGKRHLCGLDMEGLGLYAAVEVYKETTKRKIRCLLVKAVSDLGDHDKGDSYHDYGKQIAAAFVYRFIRCRDFKVRPNHK
jgi:nucleoside phosphorylase